MRAKDTACKILEFNVKMCCAVLCCAVLCCAVLCCAFFHHCKFTKNEKNIQKKRENF